MAIKTRHSLLNLYPLFFLSGTSSLIFENLWQRKLMLVFGASAPSITVILTAFFCGIAFGSWIGGKLLTLFQHRMPAMRFYALTEVWIGVFGISVPLFLWGVDVIYLALFRDLDPGPGFSMIYRFIMCMAVVLPASLGMGATVPIMSRLISECGKGIGRSVGLAYGINTLGAVVGCLATGFFLLEALGMQNSLFFASSLNAIVVIASFWLSRRSPASDPIPPEPSPPVLERFEARRVGLLALYFVAGFIAIGFEVIWMRMIAIFTTNGLTTFHLALAVYLTGFSVGSLVFYPALDRKLSGPQIFFVSSVGVAITSLAILPNAQSVTNAIWSWSHQFVKPTWPMIARNTTVEVMNTVSIMFLPTVFMGLAFPAVCKSATERKEQIASSSGFIYFVGNVGSMIGAFVTGLLLIPSLSMIGASGVLIAASCVVGALVLSLGQVRFKRVFQCACLLICAPALYFGASDTPLVRLGELVKEGDVLKFTSGPYRDQLVVSNRTGASATVMVMQAEPRPGRVQRTIYIDNQSVAATERFALVDSKMLAHIPLLLHPDPKTALTVGFGSGGTSWSMTAHGVQTDVVEIEPEVIRSSHYFEKQNFNVLDSPLLQVIINDARNHLYVTKKKYDVISTDCTNLRYKQNGSLYTREYFQLMKARLTENGISCAWIPIMLLKEEFGTLVATFLSVFPNTTVWYMDHTPTSFAMLVGTPGRIRFDYARLKRGFELEAVRRDLADIDVFHPLQMIHFLYLDETGVRHLVGDAPLHTDDEPILEFLWNHSFGVTKRSLASRIQEMWALKPGSLDHLIDNLETADVAELRRYEKFSRAWGKFTNYEHFTSRQKKDRPEYWRKGLRFIEDALEAFPDYPEALKKRERYQSVLANDQAGSR